MGAARARACAAQLQVAEVGAQGEEVARLHQEGPGDVFRRSCAGRRQMSCEGADGAMVLRPASFYPPAGGRAQTFEGRLAIGGGLRLGRRGQEKRNERQKENERAKASTHDGPPKSTAL